MSKTYMPGEQMMRSRLLQKMQQEDQKNSKQWKTPAGGLFRGMKGLYYITVIYSFMVLVLNELIFWLMGVSDPTMTDEKTAFFRSNGWIVHGLILLTVISLVFMLMKKTEIACFTHIAVGGLTVLQVVQIFVGQYSNRTLLGVLYLITLLSLVACVVMLVVLLAYHKRLENAVAEEYANIYRQYADEDYDMMTSSRLEEIVLKHETALQQGETPPESF